MNPDTVSPLTLALVAGGFTMLGILAKILYDGLAAKRTEKKRELERFAPERHVAYDRFLDLVKQERSYQAALRSLSQEAQAGRTEMSDEEQAAFPKSPMGSLVEALEQVRRLGRSYAAITSAEAILRLFVDTSRAMRAALESPSPNDEVTWFLLQRFLDERVDEFTHSYREDLGLGPPIGGPKRYPMVERDHALNLATSERMVRRYIPPSKSGASDERTAR